MISSQSAVSKARPTSESYNLHAVVCGDAYHLEKRHAAVKDLVSDDLLETYSQFPGGGPDFPVLFYLENEGQVCSYFRTIPDEITFGGETHRWAWSGDNFTFPDYRNRGLSTQLHRRATEHLHENGIGRSGVYSTDVALHVFKKIGFKLMGFARRYLMLRSARPLIDAHISHATSRTLLNATSKPLVGTAVTGLKLWNCILLNRTTCTRPDSFPTEQLRLLLPEIAASRSVHFCMDADLLRRKFEVSKRTGELSLWLIHDASSQKCLGYMIVRERVQTEPLAERYHGFRLMTLMDFGFVEGDSMAASGIAAHLISRFLGSRCDVLQIISNNDLLNRAAARRGMKKIGKGMSFTLSAPKSWNWPVQLDELHTWPLTNFSGDAFTW